MKTWIEQENKTEHTEVRVTGGQSMNRRV